MRAACGLAVLLFWMGPAPGESDNLRAIRRAMALLPRPPSTVAVIDAEDARPGVRELLLTLDAFITRGGRVVYLVKESAVLKGAAQGSRFYDCMLAGILWHEMAHVDGADELGARRAERDLWTGFVRDQRVDEMTALRYLRALDAQSLEVLVHHEVAAGIDLPPVQNHVGSITPKAGRPPSAPRKP